MGYKPPKAAKCGAKTRSGGRCKQPGTGAGGRCKFHGGATPVGPASPHFKTGRYSRLLKDIKGIGNHYERALTDPDLLTLREEIALVDARLGQLLEKVAHGGTRASIDGIWPQLELLIENRRKLVDTEAKRLKDLHAMVSVDRVMLIIRYLQDAVRRHVKDPIEQTAVFMEMRKLLKPEEPLASIPALPS
jgi:hypothetical protein